MDKNYTFKQVIFGLRNEYLEVEKKLRELEEHVSVSNKVEKFNFYIGGSYSKLTLALIRKRNILRKTFMFLDDGIFGETYFDVTKGIEKEYFYDNKKLCSINNLEVVNKKIEEITKSEFFKSIVANNYTSIPSNENKVNTLLITQGNIELINGFNGCFPHFDYHSRTDELIMTNEEKIITPDDIFKILNLSLDGKYLNEYHHKVLDNYEEKEIDIDDNFTSNKVTLQIIEEPKKLILKSKNNI